VEFIFRITQVNLDDIYVILGSVINLITFSNKTLLYCNCLNLILTKNNKTKLGSFVNSYGNSTNFPNKNNYCLEYGL